MKLHQALRSYLEHLEPFLIENGFKRKRWGVYIKPMGDIYYWLDLTITNFYPNKGFSFQIYIGVGVGKVDPVFKKLTNWESDPPFSNELNYLMLNFRDLWHDGLPIMVYINIDELDGSVAADVAKLYIVDGAFEFFDRFKSLTDLDSSINRPEDAIRESTSYFGRVIYGLLIRNITDPTSLVDLARYYFQFVHKFEKSRKKIDAAIAHLGIDPSKL